MRDYTEAEIQDSLLNEPPTDVFCPHGVTSETMKVCDDETGVLVKFFGHDNQQQTRLIHMVLSRESAEAVANEVTGTLLDTSPGRCGT